MLNIKDIIILIIFAIALYIYGRYCYNNGFEDALNARIAGIFKTDSDGKEEQVELPKNQRGNCENCLFKITDLETGEIECGNQRSQSFSKIVSLQDTCDHYCKEWEKEGYKNDD